MTKRLFVVAAVLLFAGCSLDKQNAPDFAGPSEFGLSISLTATPDLILPDGSSTIDVSAFNANGEPVAGLALRFVRSAGSGLLSADSGTTNAAGRASVTYTAPGGNTDVTITVTPIASNQNFDTRSRTIAVRVRS